MADEVNMTTSNDVDAVKIEELAGIEYHGIAGVSCACHEAVVRLLQSDASISRARIISSSNTHCLLLTDTVDHHIAIKSGFSSGYGGAGPHYFSLTLKFLEAHGVEIDECEVDISVIERLDRSALTTDEVERIETSKGVRPSRWYDYVLEDHSKSAHSGTLWKGVHPIIPYAILDSRIVDLALSFWTAPDDKLLKGYRRLEDSVRGRTELKANGSKLFSRAFSGESPALHWKDIGEGEKTGRVNLFTGAYMAFRNPQGHRELNNRPDEFLAEFLLLNLLFRLEKEARRNG